MLNRKYCAAREQGPRTWPRDLGGEPARRYGGRTRRNKASLPLIQTPRTSGESTRMWAASLPLRTEGDNQRKGHKERPREYPVEPKQRPAGACELNCY